MFEIKDSVLFVIDVQGNLAYKMDGKEKLFKNIAVLMQAVQILNIPTIITEQVPEKIGKTIPEIEKYFYQNKPLIKKSFSCLGDDQILKHLKSLKRKQVVVCGIETHVCVYQTIRDLIDHKFEVNLIVDAVSSRTLENKMTAIDRIKQENVKVASTEMIATEWLRSSTHPKFKDLLNLIR